MYEYRVKRGMKFPRLKNGLYWKHGVSSFFRCPDELEVDQIYFALGTHRNYILMFDGTSTHMLVMHTNVSWGNLGFNDLIESMSFPDFCKLITL